MIYLMALIIINKNMRKLTFEFPSEGLSKDDIELLQKNYSLVLPKSYIFFYRTCLGLYFCLNFA